MTDRGGQPPEDPSFGTARGRPERPLPAELTDAFRHAPEARDIFNALPPSHRREYVTWVADARRADTRERRAAQTVMRLLEQHAARHER